MWRSSRSILLASILVSMAADASSAQADELQQKCFGSQVIEDKLDACNRLYESAENNELKAGALFHRSLVRQFQSQSKEALADINLALSLLPGRPELLLEKARILQSGGQHEKALSLFQEVLEKRPQDVATNLSKMQSLAELGRMDEALRLADLLVAKEPGNHETWTGRAGLRARAGRQTNLQWDAWYGLALEDKQPHSYRLLGVSFTRLGRLEKARHMLGRAKIWAGGKTSKPLRAAFAELELATSNVVESPASAAFQQGQSVYGRQEYKEAFALFLKAAEAGNPLAMGNVGHMYSQGLGTKRDVEKAAHWFKTGAENGAPEAMYRYADVLRKGSGVTLDRDAATHWMARAAEQGNAQAIFEVGFAYQSGNGVEKDLRLAAAHYRAAAEQKHSKALYSLGRMFEVGNGLPANSAKAAHWMAEAVNQQNQFAVQQLTQSHDKWSRDFRRELQVILRDLGLYKGKADGAFGADTIKAINALAASE